MIALFADKGGVLEKYLDNGDEEEDGKEDKTRPS